MSKLLLSLPLLGIVLGLPATAPVGAPPPSPQDAEGALPVVTLPDGERLPLEPGIDALAFLEGRWAGSAGSSRWESSYSSAAGGQIVGASKELSDGRVVTIDFEHFYEREGALRMTPFPGGRRSVEFTLTEFSGAAKRAVFENAAHDFPRRFTYRATGPDHLQIELLGEMGGETLRIVLEFERR